MNTIDRGLILKILGTDNRVILEDQVFNTINILEVFREVILKKRTLSKNDISSSIAQLEKINMFILDLIKALEKITGFTNSKEYLLKYLKDFSKHIILLNESIDRNNTEGFILHTNILMDLALKY